MDKKIIKNLLAWFYQNDRNQRQDNKLIWRRLGQAQDPWWVLVSEVMLQQTTVATIAKRFPVFIKQFPTPDAMAAAGIDKVLDAWAGLGYYRRAHKLFAAAQTIAVDWQGRWRTDLVSIKQLPGVGDYTGRALATLAFEQPTIPYDGNMIRVLSRYIKRDIQQTKKPAVQKILVKYEKNLFAKKNLPKNFVVSDWVQAMMDLANAICTPAEPSCAICPVASGCQGKKNWRIYPRPKIKTVKPILYGAVMIYQNNQGQYLLQRRVAPPTPLSTTPPSTTPAHNHSPKPIADHWGGLYRGLLTFPTSPLVRDRQDLHSYLQTNNKKPLLSSGKKTESKTMDVVHDLTHRRLVLSLVFCDDNNMQDDNNQSHNLWVGRDELMLMPLPSIMKKVVRQIID